MADPMTLGAIAAVALGMAAEAMLKGTVSEVVKDAYKRVKATLSGRAASDVAALERQPTSPELQALVADTIDGLSPNETAAIHESVRQLSSALALERPIGIDVGRLSALNLTLEDIEVSGGTGVRIADAKISNDVNIRGVRVGESEGKKKT